MKAGSLLHTSKPYVHSVLASQRAKRCDHCLKCVAPGNLRRCSACTVSFYCSVGCQKEAWTFHKLECKCFKRVSPRIPTESVLLLLRLIQRFKLGEHKTVSETIWGKTRTFSDLMHHAEALKQDEKRLGEFIHITQTLKVFVGEKYQLPTPVELFEIFGRMVVNTYTVCDGEMMPVGVGLYLGPSAIDHSCRPNAVVVMEGTDLQIRCTTDLDLATDEVKVSYIDQLKLTKERQDELQEQYYFTCHCAMCSDKDMDALMQSLKCPNCGSTVTHKGEVHLCAKCEKPCGADVIKEYGKLVATTKSALEELRMKGKQEGLTAVKDLLKQQDPIMDKMNVYNIRTLDKAMDAAIDNSMWNDAILYGSATLGAYRRYYPECHPNVGVQLMKIGKLHLYEKHLHEASVCFLKAETVLSMTHGIEHSLYVQLLTMMDQCNEERRVLVDKALPEIEDS